MIEQPDLNEPVAEPDERDVRITTIIGTDPENSAPVEEVVEQLPTVVAAAPSRIDVLTEAIEQAPSAPVNYVLRGELLLDGQDYDLAAADFEKVLKLADSLAESANWGYIYRALIDRAQQGLRQCQPYREPGQ